MTIASPAFQKAFSDITGLEKSRCDAVFRRCREEELFEKCQGARFAKLYASHSVLLLFAAIANVPVHNAPKVAKLYYNLRDHEGRCRAGDYIASLIDKFDPTNLDPDQAKFAYRSWVLVDMENPRIVVSHECDDGPIEEVFGTKEPRSFETRVSTTKRISGKLLFDVAGLLNKDKWDVRGKRAA